MLKMADAIGPTVGVIALAITLSSCAGSSALPVGQSITQSGTTITIVDSTELPGPNGQIGVAQAYEYTIGPYDKLVVDVLGFEVAGGRRVQVDGSGMISLPVSGPVRLGGLTLPQAVERIEQQMRQAYVRDPQVSVNLEESLSQYVTVDGEVETPGNYPIVAQMTLMRAVAAARGTTDFARLRDVVVHRRVNGTQMVALYNLDAIRRGATTDPIIYPQDIVVVGNSPSRRLFQQFLQVSPLFVSPLVAILDNN
jgi:polysaccharide export outer membrane protein